MGYWKANIKEGIAIFIEDNGHLFSGEFKNDRLAHLYFNTNHDPSIDSGIIHRELSKVKVDLKDAPKEAKKY